MDNISYIHSNKTAIYNKLYYGKDGVYIGLKNGRLKKYESISQNIPTEDLGYIPEDVSNKVTDFSSPDDITYPTSKAVNDAILAIPSTTINKIMAYIAAKR